MEDKDYKKINELLKSSIVGLDANTTAYINNMIKEAKKDLVLELLGCDLDVPLHLRLDNKAEELGLRDSEKEVIVLSPKTTKAVRELTEKPDLDMLKGLPNKTESEKDLINKIEKKNLTKRETELLIMLIEDEKIREAGKEANLNELETIKQKLK